MMNSPNGSGQVKKPELSPAQKRSREAFNQARDDSHWTPLVPFGADYGFPLKSPDQAPTYLEFYSSYIIPNAYKSTFDNIVKSNHPVSYPIQDITWASGNFHLNEETKSVTLDTDSYFLTIDRMLRLWRRDTSTGQFTIQMEHDLNEQGRYLTYDVSRNNAFVFTNSGYVRMFNIDFSTTPHRVKEYPASSSQLLTPNAPIIFSSPTILQYLPTPHDVLISLASYPSLVIHDFTTSLSHTTTLLTNVSTSTILKIPEENIPSAAWDKHQGGVWLSVREGIKYNDMTGRLLDTRETFGWTADGMLVEKNRVYAWKDKEMAYWNVQSKSGSGTGLKQSSGVVEEKNWRKGRMWTGVGEHKIGRMEVGVTDDMVLCSMGGVIYVYKVREADFEGGEVKEIKGFMRAVLSPMAMLQAHDFSISSMKWLGGNINRDNEEKSSGNEQQQKIADDRVLITTDGQNIKMWKFTEQFIENSRYQIENSSQEGHNSSEVESASSVQENSNKTNNNNGSEEEEDGFMNIGSIRYIDTQSVSQKLKRNELITTVKSLDEVKLAKVLSTSIQNKFDLNFQFENEEGKLMYFPEYIAANGNKYIVQDFISSGRVNFLVRNPQNGKSVMHHVNRSGVLQVFLNYGIGHLLLTVDDYGKSPYHYFCGLKKKMGVNGKNNNGEQKEKEKNIAENNGAGYRFGPFVIEVEKLPGSEEYEATTVVENSQFWNDDLEKLIKISMDWLRTGYTNPSIKANSRKILQNSSNNNNEEVEDEELKRMKLEAEEDVEIRREILNLRDVDGSTALHFAMSAGRSDAVKELCRAGVRVNVKESLSGFTPLHLGVMIGDYASIAMLLSEGFNVDINAQDARGNTALHYATEKTDVEMIKILSRGSNREHLIFDIKNNDGFIPEDLTIREDVKKLVRESGKRKAVLVGEEKEKERDREEKRREEERRGEEEEKKVREKLLENDRKLRKSGGRWDWEDESGNRGKGEEMKAEGLEGRLKCDVEWLQREELNEEQLRELEAVHLKAIENIRQVLKQKKNQK
eukprot:TRINITY_DN779_c0_g1_i3.p1 TRINITY_DN779_c0_g1~~TRINITY_DN779_c0_g1_i3.p1  ORF type:complete len:1089 (-),score=364.90 TRINITY_DN779_c0_g1_i3:60-3149(-)